ncbi:tetratricopeptide repeat protein [Calycomorphotria hydatis]|uniref:Tetratricopeptide repeat protein n=1 Tax=Calycomorphotria hydatis TaxID=2528027 RepID=A0A517TF29_9PLAN|nr:tetratricopeptide repeat protein [Calycomorphotria hydatis]QDT66968.1 tetratricopeptide repeat protein [Calycomorphotria hydatis]
MRQILISDLQSAPCVAVCVVIVSIFGGINNTAAQEHHHVTTAPQTRTSAQRAGRSDWSLRSTPAFHTGHQHHAHNPQQRMAEQPQSTTPHTVNDPFLLVERFISEGQRPQAVSQLNMIAKQHAKSAEIQNKCGQFYLSVGANQPGMKSLMRAISLEPSNAQYAADLAGAYVRQGKTDSAIMVLEHAVERCRAPQLYASLGRLHEQSAQWSRAVDAYKWALTTDSDNQRMRLRLAECHYHLQQYDEAVQLYSQVAGEHGDWLSLGEYVRFSDACLRTGELKMAERALNTLAEISPVTIREIEVLRAITAYKRGFDSRAERIATSALSRWEDDKELLQVISLIHGADSELREEEGILPASYQDNFSDKE